jgi:hypothetical protein
MRGVEMNNEIMKQAEYLAERNYSFVAFIEIESDGRRLFRLEHPELPGCIAVGYRMDAVLRDLKTTTITHLYHLLVTEQPIPLPEIERTRSGNIANSFISSGFYKLQNQSPFDEVIKKVIQPHRRQHIMSWYIVYKSAGGGAMGKR